MKKTLMIAISAIAMLITFSCSKNDSNTKNGKKTKITVSTTNLSREQNDAFHIIIVGVSPTGGAVTWKVNGETRTNELGLTIGEEQFASGTTYVIESTDNFSSLNVSLAGVNFSSAFTVNYKIEINGDVKNNLNDVVTENYTKVYTY